MRCADDAIVDLDALCDMLNRSWPPPGGEVEGTITSVASSARTDNELGIGADLLQSTQLHLPEDTPYPTGTGTSAVTTKADEPSAEAHVESAWVDIDQTDTSRPSPFVGVNKLEEVVSPTSTSPHDIRATPSQPTKFSEQAMRVLDECEALLCSSEREKPERLHEILKEISHLRKRYGHASSVLSSTRCSILRKRYTLDVAARRILRNWVDSHLNDPYPSVQEKQTLCESTNLSLKQINDWFTNYRKRHWENEITLSSNIQVD